MSINQLKTVDLYRKYIDFIENWQFWLKFDQCSLTTTDSNLVFSSVPFGEDLMKEAMMKSLGVPLSKTYMKKAYFIFLERFWRVGKFNPELSCLSIKDGEHLRNNCRLALAIFVSKLEHCTSGYEQVIFVSIGDYITLGRSPLLA